MAHVRKRSTKAGDNRYDVRARIGGRVVTRTFKRRKDAGSYATTIEADRLRGIAIDPRLARVTLESYAKKNLAGRTNLAVRTADQYQWLLDKHLVPTLGGKSLCDINPSTIRTWHAEIAHDHPSTAAKAYRLLSSIMRAAVADEIITRNPCQVKGAAVENAAERPTASIAEVFALADAMPEHLRVAVLLASWCQLRRGEMLGLRRMDVDPLRSSLNIEITRGPRMGGAEIIKTPKTEAGRRSISIPASILPSIEHHLKTYVGPSLDAPFLVGEKGRPLLVKSLNREWDKARIKIGRRDLRLHDLRHSGLTWAAATGATVAELMRRAGHKSPAAALRYQHATEDRDRALAAALTELSRSAQVVPIKARDGRAIEQQSGETEQEDEAKIVALTREDSGGDDGTRTHDPLLAKQVL
jgi:integrase